MSMSTAEGMTKRKKIIIDTDPGIDDAMAILFAFQSTELEVVGMTTIFGNVFTPTATANAIHLCEFAGKGNIPVSEGEHVTFNGEPKTRVADFVHGHDGLGNTQPTPPLGKPVKERAPEFLAATVAAHPKEITVVALGPFTNVAKAIKLDPMFVENVAEIVVLGGAFYCNGNVNPAAEANVFNDPDAADILFTSGAPVRAIGINITHQVMLMEEDFEEMRRSGSECTYAQYVAKAAQFYLQYHKDSYGIGGVYIHDPAVMAAVVAPSLFTYAEGPVRVQTGGISRGMSILYLQNSSSTALGLSRHHPWEGQPEVKVAISVRASEVAALVKNRLLQPPPLPEPPPNPQSSS
eukprot:TRINITY_DN1552_c0_g1_i1.p1 TRINITY_DN1552_c0_g1~~TRINITY_DN1552_c0_g1_i1.p1  ORF type:complete len:350 (+),score=97.20 TRINITY_DN1552_c0_g1_i1:38-1087(+)